MDSLPTNAKGFTDAIGKLASPAQAATLQRFFKTAPGQYAEGDIFIGVKVPLVRGLVRQFRQMPPSEAAKLVRSPIHEHRLGGLLIWVQAFERGEQGVQDRVFDLYLRHTRYINNWDLVDLSAPQIVGRSLPYTDTTFLQTLAESPLLWERRIAMLATFTYIREGQFGPTMRLCRQLMRDKHDLMHKACGWMLREIGKRDRGTLSAFLDRHATALPRTTLRYALEHYDPEQRQVYMAR